MDDTEDAFRIVVRVKGGGNEAEEEHKHVATIQRVNAARRWRRRERNRPDNISNHDEAGPISSNPGLCIHPGRLYSRRVPGNGRSASTPSSLRETCEPYRTSRTIRDYRGIERGWQASGMQLQPTASYTAAAGADTVARNYTY